MSAIEIALHRSLPSPRPAASVVHASRVREWFADSAIRLAELIAGDDDATDRRPELAGNPWARPIGLAGPR